MKLVCVLIAISVASRVSAGVILRETTGGSTRARRRDRNDRREHESEREGSDERMVIFCR
jgi:hypothetical protein